MTGSYVPPSLADSKMARISPGLRRALLASVAALVAAGIVLAIIAQWGQFPDVELRFSPGWAVLAVIGFLASELTHATLWRIVLRRLGGEIEPLDGLRVWSLSSLGRYLPPGLLMPAIRVAGASAAGVAARITLASMAYEGVLSVLGALIVSLLLLTEAAEWTPILIGAAAAVILIVSVHPSVFERLANAALRRLGRDDIPTVLPGRAVVPLVLAYAGSFVLVGLGVYATVEAIHPVDASVLPVAVASFSVGFLVSLAVFFVPGGLGIRDASLAGVLRLVIPFALAVAVSVGVRLVQIALELLLAGVTTLLVRRRSVASPSG